jgi:hypothetical protein
MALDGPRLTLRASLTWRWCSFSEHKDVKAMGSLQKAYEASDVGTFMSVADEIERSSDDFIRESSPFCFGSHLAFLSPPAPSSCCVLTSVRCFVGSDAQASTWAA